MGEVIILERKAKPKRSCTLEITEMDDGLAKTVIRMYEGPSDTDSEAIRDVMRMCESARMGLSSHLAQDILGAPFEEIACTVTIMKDGVFTVMSGDTDLTEGRSIDRIATSLSALAGALKKRQFKMESLQ